MQDVDCVSVLYYLCNFFWLGVCSDLYLLFIGLFMVFVYFVSKSCIKYEFWVNIFSRLWLCIYFLMRSFRIDIFIS